ncbi:uncharacterized protein LOC110447701 [Mizuhopecten yessoensis]|uniref:Uncharacterized protein n=1 Tax=Mizuhopecten yessoensis TaxID=6573 RepID=A0A210QUQ8_MIZYE|nr:uncharacterized protein LOC110447701 [Mizuhopecten yessoensis]XP_021349226.1 uncharacterized protein LOC110447701 [Mizuhopecten yessoensis]XP_021349227.1 uncharacterized protein LOC110447701 [Mizuhopecten yessoensis]OWF52464.1 hypothetical protein KP79_PYT06879 [Mizuhopecten yessoensis]
MGRTRLSDTSSDSSKKKDKQATSSKSCQNDKDNSDSDSADVQPQVYPGTHWPLDATLELYINYDAVKEIRGVKSDFYPMLFYLTKCDYSSVARVVSKLPVIMDHLQARLDKVKGLTQTSTSVEAKPAPPTTTPLIRDLKTAKEEMLKLVSNMCLSQKDAGELLDWVKTLETKKKGRTGYQLCEQEVTEDLPKPVTRTQSKTEDKLSSSKIQTNSDSKPVSTNTKPVSTNSKSVSTNSKPVSMRNQAKTDSKSDAKNTVKSPQKDAVPIGRKVRPPTGEEIFANINNMTVAQICTQANNANSKQVKKSLKDKTVITTLRKRGRPPKRKFYQASDTDSETVTVSTKRKSKSRPSKSVSPAASESSSSQPILSSPTSSPLKFSLSKGAKQHASDVIKDILNKQQQSSEVGKRDIIAGDEWSQGTPQPVRIPTQPFRNNFGPVPMCLYRVQADTDVPTENDSLDLITPKIEIDNAEEDEPYGRCVVKMEVGNSDVSMLQSSSSVESSVTASGLSQKLAPIIRTICTGPVCGGDNCVYEHSVIVQDCDSPEMDCVVESFVQEAKEAEPIIIIDDC